MKKLAAVLASLTLVLALGLTGLAAEVNGGSHDVTATYKEGDKSNVIYSVDVTWGSMEFTYTSPAQGTWNPDTHAYDGAQTTGTWTCEDGANAITVINHTNAAVNVNLTYASAETYAAISGSFDKAELALATAAGTTVDQAPSASAALTLTGELPASEEAVTIGSITVTLGK